VGDLFGVPEWVAVTGFVIAGLALCLGIGANVIRRAHTRVAARRLNPTEAEFLAMMAPDCSPEAARFLWQQALPYVEPHLTPHPDDLLLDDLCIDDGDVTMDWPQVWTDLQGISERDLPDWPKNWPLTVRNFARWLDLGRTSAPAG
jgi:hypothetical protein